MSGVDNGEDIRLLLDLPGVLTPLEGKRKSGSVKTTPAMKQTPLTPQLVSNNPQFVSKEIQEMRQRVEIKYPGLLDSLNCSDGNSKVKMWDPLESMELEMYRDVQLVMHTIFPNPELEEAMWAKLNKSKLISDDRHETELKEMEKSHREFLIRYILLLRHNLSYRERQDYCTQKLTWNLPIACLFCHGGRVLIEVEGGDPRQLLSILFNGKTAMPMPLLTCRRSSHELRLIDDVFHEVRACYAPCEGFNISFGGLGNQFDYKGSIIGPGGVGLQRTTFRKALDYLSGREQQGHVLIKWKNETLAMNEHVPVGAMLIGIETADYRYKSGFFGQGHSLIGCRNAKSVTNGEKMAEFFARKEKKPPCELGGIRSYFHISNISSFEDYCEHFFKLSFEDQKVFLMSVLVLEVETGEEMALGFPRVCNSV